MLVSTLISEEQIAHVSAEVREEFKRDVVSIRGSEGYDWSGDPAISFGIVLKDAATRGKRLRIISRKIDDRLWERVRQIRPELLVYCYFRSESEQPDSDGEPWW